MLLAIDIGNSLIKFGVFDGTDLFDRFSIATKSDYEPGELQFDRLKFADGHFLNIDTVLVATVVPALIDAVRQASQDQFKVTPTFVDHSFDFGLKINYEPLATLGIDRIINASAAVARYGKPVVVCSFGTAMTVDAVNGKGYYLGGIIAPGMKMMTESLNTQTAQLPRVAIERPKRVIAGSTIESIQSGVYYGGVGMAGALIDRVKKELGKKAKVIATGGFAAMISTEVNNIDTVDENLTLEGLRLLASA